MYVYVITIYLLLLTVPIGTARANVDNTYYTDGLHGFGTDKHSSGTDINVGVRDKTTVGYANRL